MAPVDRCLLLDEVPEVVDYQPRLPYNAAEAMGPEREPERDERELADPEWFRPPTRREHWIAAGLFVAFGIFFVLLFVVLAGWWFRWVVLALGLISVWQGLRHARVARQAKV